LPLHYQRYSILLSGSIRATIIVCFAAFTATSNRAVHEFVIQANNGPYQSATASAIWPSGPRAILRQSFGVFRLIIPEERRSHA
jgi:hypothetical protein